MYEYLKTLITEKGRELDDIIEVEGPSGMNIMPLGVLVDAIDGASKSDQLAIKTNLVKIDFVNGNVFDYLKHLARAIAI